MKKGSPERGKVVLTKAKCLECHKLGDQGAGLGPDLTTVSSRFRPSEILESIIEPSKVISDQYKPITIATTDGKVFNGMPTGSEADKIVLLLSDGTKATIAKADVEAQKDSKISVNARGAHQRPDDPGDRGHDRPVRVAAEGRRGGDEEIEEISPRRTRRSRRQKERKRV